MPAPSFAAPASGRSFTIARPTARSRAVTADARWDLLLVCLAGYLLTAVGRVHQLFPVLQPIHPTLLLALLAGVLYLLIPSTEPWRHPALLTRSRALLWMGALLVWAALSIPGALWVGGAFRTVADVLVKSVVMAVVLVGAIRGIRDVERLAGAYCAAMVLYSGVVLTRFSVGEVAWRLDDLYYYDANDFATLAVTAIPIALYFALRARTLPGRLAGGAGLLLLISAFLWTGSRGGFVAIVAVGLFILLGYTAIPLRWRLGATAALVLVVAGTASETYWAKMRTLLHPTEDYNLESPEGRSAIWRRGIGYLAANPVFGVGAGNFPTAEGTISPLAVRQSVGRGVKWQAAHNSFVQVGAELGVPGLFFFVAMIVVAFKGLRTRWRRVPRPGTVVDARAAPLAQALGASLIGFAVGALFLSLAYTEALYVLVALASGLRRSPAW